MPSEKMESMILKAKVDQLASLNSQMKSENQKLGLEKKSLEQSLRQQQETITLISNQVEEFESDYKKHLTQHSLQIKQLQQENQRIKAKYKQLKVTVHDL